MALNYSIMMSGNPFEPQEPEKAYANNRKVGETFVDILQQQIDLSPPIYNIQRLSAGVAITSKPEANLNPAALKTPLG